MAALPETDIIGFEVEALDGRMGKVADVDEDRTCLTVKPGLLRRRHLIPTQFVSSVDRRRHCVRVQMTKHQIAAAPSPLREHWNEPPRPSDNEWYMRGGF